MCDTFVVTGRVRRDGGVLFGKNSDREPNEAQQVERVPAADFAPGSTVRCTYLDIPQVTHTHAVLLCRPFWMWGAEMGANEHGVVIGNEAVFTRVPRTQTPTLTGMDLLRLALERSRTADEALTTITTLLERHGQGGNCGYSHPFYYDNSFILADARGAWVLETAGRQWVARRVQEIASISNALTIEDGWDAASADVQAYAVEMGWQRRDEPFNFRKAYSDRLYTPLGRGVYRQSCTESALRRRTGPVDLRDAFGVLRMHGAPGWRADRGVLGAEVCMHAGFGPVRNSQTTGSLVSALADGVSSHWVTATAAPCTSVFKPVWLDCDLPDMGPALTGEFNPGSLWWRHEALHRAALQALQPRLAAYAQERDGLEESFVTGASGLAAGSVEARAAYSQECFDQAGRKLDEWTARVMSVPAGRLDVLYASAWRNWNRAAKLPNGQ